jgi:hypothetical protein
MKPQISGTTVREYSKAWSVIDKECGFGARGYQKHHFTSTDSVKRKAFSTIACTMGYITTQQQLQNSSLFAGYYQPDLWR